MSEPKVNGPSPRVWGEPRSTPALRAAQRTIPTRVGRTLGSYSPAPQFPDHPHACGENISTFARYSPNGGPSPRVWGEPPNTSRHETKTRTIPTRVGRTPQPTRGSAAPSDHPHACGENVFNYRLADLDHGPSPRVWGELERKEMTFLGARTIPTRVGRTWRPGAVVRIPSDHPHACGENSCSCRMTDMQRGPSPRVWGELDTHRNQCSRKRTIPTRVGRTGKREGAHSRTADHPHACGENACPGGCSWHSDGPSPRVWGEPRE